jgi:hypothetical protein
METEADKVLKEAIVCLNECISKMLMVINPNTSGNKDFHVAYLACFEKATTDLFKIKRELET